MEVVSPVGCRHHRKRVRQRGKELSGKDFRGAGANGCADVVTRLGGYSAYRLPPISAGIGGGKGVVDVGVVEVGVDDVAVAVPDVVVVVVVVVLVVVDVPGDFGACEPWKSCHDSVRIVVRPELTVSPFELTV